MNIKVYDNENLAGKAGAMLIGAQILRKPDSVLGFATGSTPVLTYKELIKMTEGNLIDWGRITTFNLDEYVGLPADHDQSYQYFMKDKLFSRVNLRETAIHLPDGMAEDPEAECMAYERAIREAGGVDLQLLGIGRNGHIGFNEPAEAFAPHTHCSRLTDDTIEANARFFSSADEVPRKALTMGIGTIMRSWQVVLIATGAEKARAVSAMVQGPIDPKCPASILQTHPRVTIILDRAAAVALTR